MTQARIILGLMIGDEDPALVRRCLEAAAPHVDAVCVQYNGVPPMARLARAVGGPGIAIGKALRSDWQTVPWESFGANRSKLFRQCQARAERAGSLQSGGAWSLAETYVLILDADHVLHGPVTRDLTAPGYHVQIRDAWGLVYQRLNLLRLDCPWRSKWPTHEAWVCDGVTRDDCPALPGDAYIEDRDDGTCKADKYERDEGLIRTWLEDHPRDTRMLFYLAQTLWCLWKRDHGEQQRIEALAANLRAAHADGWVQERVVSLLRASECAATPEYMDQLAQEALTLDCTRAEAWLRRAEVAHSLRDWPRVAQYATYALECVPRPDGLFVESQAYGWRAFDLAALGWYRMGDNARARDHWAAALCSTPAPNARAEAMIAQGLARARGGVPPEDVVEAAP